MQVLLDAVARAGCVAIHCFSKRLLGSLLIRKGGQKWVRMRGTKV